MIAAIKLALRYECGHESACFVDVTIRAKDVRELESTPGALEAELFRRIDAAYDFSEMTCPEKRCRKPHRSIADRRISKVDYFREEDLR